MGNNGHRNSQPSSRIPNLHTAPPLFPGEEKNHDPSRWGNRLKKRLMLAVAAFFSGGYALWEPHLLDVVKVDLSLPGFPKEMNGLRIIQFSDVHLGFHTHLKQMEKLASVIGELQPDVICFTGDMVEREAAPMREYISVLSSMQAKYGKFAVLGNHDYRGKEQNQVAAMLQEAGFILLCNGHAVLRNGNSRIALVGLDDGLTGSPDPKKAVQGLDDGIWKLLLMHEPDYADYAAPLGFGMQLSGHSHGGQVRFPLLGAMTTPRGSRKYIKGLYYVGKRHMPVYVNRGFGMTQLPIRFLCKPELTVFQLKGMPERTAGSSASLENI